MTKEEPHIRGLNKRKQELRAQGKSASQAGRQAFRELADKQWQADRDAADRKNGGKR